MKLINTHNEEKQYIDISKITPDCDLVKSIIALHRNCKLKHKEGCFAETCEECLARTFNGYHNQLLPLVKKGEELNLFNI